MAEVKHADVLLSVASFMSSCGISVAAEGGALSASCGENATDAELERIDFSLNTTNLAHLIYGTTANLAAVLLYGSNFVPVRRTETGDGVFVQWVTCAAIWVVSMVGNLILQSPRFCPFAMLGGALWATGTLAVIPVINTIGLALGTLIWGCSSLLFGWASSRFSWFGIPSEVVPRPTLNYSGAVLCLIGGLTLLFVRPHVELHHRSELLPLLIDRTMHSGSLSLFWIDISRPKTRRFIGCLLAAVLGLLYGSSLIPMLYIKSHSSFSGRFHGANSIDLDHVFAQCSGTFFASTVYFIIYCAAMNNRPKVYSTVILPGLLAGLMWAVATYLWYLGSNYLSAVITSPIVSAGYGLIGALWGSVVFKEIQGSVNCAVFIFAICILLMGSLLIAFSKL